MARKVKAQSEKRYEVTISVPELNHRQTVTVAAADEWKARTRAMFVCTAPLKGEQVEYTVVEVR